MENGDGMGGGARGGTESIGGGLQLAPCIGGLFHYLGLLVALCMCLYAYQGIKLPCPELVCVNFVSHRHWWLIHSPLQSIEGARLLPGPFHFSAGFDFRDGYAGLGYSTWHDCENLESERKIQ